MSLIPSSPNFNTSLTFLRERGQSSKGLPMSNIPIPRKYHFPPTRASNGEFQRDTRLKKDGNTCSKRKPFVFQELRSMFEKQAGVEKFDLIQSFHACKQEEGKSVSDYLLKMKGYVEQLEQEDNQVGSARSRIERKLKQGALYLYVGNGVRAQVEEIGSFDLVLPNGLQDGLLKSTNDESFDKCESCLSGKMAKKPFPHSNERAKDLLEIIHTDVCGPLRQCQDKLTPPYTPQHNGVSDRKTYFTRYGASMMNLITLPLSFWDYALESATRILNMVPTKKVDKTPYEIWYGKVSNLSYLKVAEFFEKRLISQEISGRAVDLEEIQEEEYTTPSEITSNIPQEVKGFEPPQEEVIPIWDLNEPTSYKAAMLDSKSNKWIDAMNAEIQSMMDNMCFAMKDLGEATFILGIKIYRDRSKRLIRLCQNAYMDKILKRYKKDNSKRGHIPMQERLDLNKTQGAQTPKEVNRMKTLELNAIAMPGFETDRDDTKSRQDMFSFLMEAQWIGRLQAK
ncbi:retrotransposon protein, putative, ty1-copia subclass [Tanacetum coccineum]